LGPGARLAHKRMELRYRFSSYSCFYSVKGKTSSKECQGMPVVYDNPVGV